MENNLTQQEKIEFANNIMSEQTQKKLKYGKRYITSGYFWLVGGAVAIGTILALNIVTTSFFLPLALFTWAEFSIMDLLRGYKAVTKAVKDAGYGKISYRQYKKLLKSGELDRWVKGDTKSRTTVEAKPAQQQEGVTLTAEEVAVLKKLMDKKVVASVEEVQQVANPDQTPTPTDTGRNA